VSLCEIVEILFIYTPPNRVYTQPSHRRPQIEIVSKKITKLAFLNRGIKSKIVKDVSNTPFAKKNPFCKKRYTPKIKRGHLKVINQKSPTPMENLHRASLIANLSPSNYSNLEGEFFADLVKYYPKQLLAIITQFLILQIGKDA